jgi:tRNA isopentenyl-2-thiomethyl-A-37 hydroxylase MiaE
MDTEREMMVLMRGKLEGLKQVQELLRKRGIPSEIRRPDGKQAGGG